MLTSHNPDKESAGGTWLYSGHGEQGGLSSPLQIREGFPERMMLSWVWNVNYWGMAGQETDGARQSLPISEASGAGAVFGYWCQR